MRRSSLTLFHGSPHQFDAFRSHAIGRGEGFQTFGHGLYFAESRRVADSYRKDMESGGQDSFFFGGVLLAEGTPQRKAASELFHSGRRDALRFLRECVRDEKAGKMEGRGHAPDHWQKAYDFAFNVKASEIKRIRGNIYVVDVAAPATAFLDWDEPLRLQPRPVLKHFDGDGALALKEVEIYSGVSGYLVLRGPLADKKEPIITGCQLYRRAAERMGGWDGPGRPAASQYFASLGIEGIRYLDGESRQRVRWRNPQSASRYDADTLDQLSQRLGRSTLAFRDVVEELRRESEPFGYPGDVLTAIDRGDLQGHGTRNYVVFREEIITITHRNGLPVAPQENRTVLAEMKAQDQSIIAAEEKAAAVASQPDASAYLPTADAAVESASHELTL